ncbi:sporulation protein, YlmC/YmxH family [Thermoanaerobacter mathranii subsp. mathranii str. A3]|uniref:Sporulation protein, YlmC/YmxH family n=3 Tax=Thermoanaerobacter TaxID=1754 RepID=D3T908_THEIA|nr:MULTISPECIES: YlmC/YmxH family sporulation protein [Thermoanaerobacter]ADD02440.1 sporulation protein, YlmC/YmxH family [Thermoanaerobacter italicus Ab9]ADH60943.1 sporulation protein, YlmC/YmxH family [Thermoanaerobacter mathranii subsp. mathranii str. A3]MBT1279919.1 YlmC/YmxH family sporulation protein [Thermoanaerobacter sp. CM-CNRG TB177]MDP9751946.1 YlmC/YmxH family sporulation protein [Thermoanaerobacter pentosaceus]
MRLSEFGNKEIVNLTDGRRWGLVEDSDLVIDEETGRIHSIIVYESGGLFRGKTNYIEISWDSIRKIGDDMLIVEFEEKKRRFY